MPDPALEAAGQFFAAGRSGRRDQAGNLIAQVLRVGPDYSAWGSMAPRSGFNTSRSSRLGPIKATVRVASPTVPTGT